MKWMSMYLRGCTDREIAEQEGVSIVTVAQRRRSYNLPPNKKPYFNNRKCPVGARPQWERDIVRDFVKALLQLDDRTPCKLIEKHIGQFMRLWRPQVSKEGEYKDDLVDIRFGCVSDNLSTVAL